MNMHEFCARWKISYRTAREMDKAECLRLDPAAPDSVADIRAYLMRDNPLPALMAARLVNQPDLVDKIGGKPELRAVAALAKLGNVQPAPRDVAAGISEAAFGEPDELTRLIDWLKQIIPAKPVEHNYIAVRLLLAWPANMREKIARPIFSALAHARRSEAMAGWFHIDKSGRRPKTIYQRPKTLDL